MILHAEMFGEGERIVFLHSGLQTGLTDFEYQRDYFQKGFQVIVPDLRGHGKSKNNDFSNYFNDCAADLAETLDYHQLDSIHLIGCSLGALVALHFAKKFPEKIASLTLSGIFAEKPSNWSEMNHAQAKQQKEFLRNEQAVEYYDQLHESDWKQFIYMGEDEKWYPFDETSDLSHLSSPTLILVGEGNELETAGTLIYPKMNDKVHVSIIPFASHLVHLEQPELYTQVLEVFIKRVICEKKEKETDSGNIISKQ
ncbi:alpha/beta fold hydrolase [Bacillus salacetis]|uniref:alpha/beta fold hydrolase n=1 Tax=Bacillus salacetis TaxID=2315464 RepID=UPI003BA0D2A0